MNQCKTNQSHRMLLLTFLVAAAGAVGVATSEETAPHTFEQCSEAVQSEDPAIRIAALQELAAFYPRKGMLPIMRYMQDETNEDVLIELARTVALTKHPQGAKLLVGILEKTPSNRRRARMTIIRALGYLQGAEAIPALTKIALEDRSEVMKKEVYRSLGNIPQASRVVQKLAIQELESTHDRSSYFTSEIDTISRRIAALGPMAAPPLYQQLERNDWMATRIAAVAIGKMRPPGGHLRILSAMKRHSRIQWRGLEGLQYYAEPNSIPPLLTMFPRLAEYGRWHLAIVCGRAGDARTTGYLTNMLKTDAEYRRTTAAWSLALIGGDKVLDVLLEELWAGDASRAWLCEAIAKIGDPRAVPELLRGATDSYEMLDFRKTAATAVAWCATEESIPEIETAIETVDDLEVREALEKSLKLVKTKIEAIKNPPKDIIEAESLKVLDATRGRVFAEMPLYSHFTLSDIYHSDDYEYVIAGGPDSYSGLQALVWHAATFGDKMVVEMPLKEDFYGKVEVGIGTGENPLRLNIALNEDPFGQEFSLEQNTNSKPLSLGKLYLPAGKHKITFTLVDIEQPYYYYTPEYQGVLMVDYIKLIEKAPAKPAMKNNGGDKNGGENGPGGGW